MDDLVTYLIVTYDNETSVSAAERVMHQKGLYAIAIFILEVRVVNVLTIT